MLEEQLLQLSQDRFCFTYGSLVYPLFRIDLEVVIKTFVSFSYDWVIIVVDVPCYSTILMLIIIMMVDAYFKCNPAVCFISDKSSTTKFMRQNVPRLSLQCTCW